MSFVVEVKSVAVNFDNRTVTKPGSLEAVSKLPPNRAYGISLYSASIASTASAVSQPLFPTLPPAR